MCACTYVYNMEIAVKATHVHIEWNKTTAIRDKADSIEQIFDFNVAYFKYT